MSIETVTHKAFRVIGSTDEVTTCDYCGRQELKGTIALAVVDADGTEDGVVYYGTGCAATAGKRTVKSVRDEVKAADKAAREAWAAQQEADSRAFCAARDAWVIENIGPDAMNRPKNYGYSSCIKVVQAFIDATGHKF